MKINTLKRLITACCVVAGLLVEAHAADGKDKEYAEKQNVSLIESKILQGSIQEYKLADQGLSHIEKLETRVAKLENAIGFLLPISVHNKEDIVRKCFCDIVQSHLTGIFGAYKVLSAGLIARAEPDYMIGVIVAQQFISCVPFDPGLGATVNAAIEVAKFLQGQHQAQIDGDMYHIFSSFSEIDIASRMAAEGIFCVYKDCINLLTPNGAIDLAHSVGETLRWFITEKPHKAVLAIDQLIMAVGQYCKSEQNKKSADKRELETKQRGGTISPLDILLASAISCDGKEYQLCREKGSAKLDKYVFTYGRYPNRVFSFVPTKTSLTRVVNKNYFDEIQKFYNENSYALQEIRSVQVI